MSERLQRTVTIYNMPSRIDQAIALSQLNSSMKAKIDLYLNNKTDLHNFITTEHQLNHDETSPQIPQPQHQHGPQ
jgi:hypothetical protein